MHYSPLTEECPLALSPFKACVAPRPIGWISTVSRDGVDNLAPFSQFQNLSYDPPMVMIACNQGGDEPDNVFRKDTVVNILLQCGSLEPAEADEHHRRGRAAPGGRIRDGRASQGPLSAHPLQAGGGVSHPV